VEPTSAQFLLQVSRDIPGGYPIFYVGKGYKPSASNADYTLDTNVNSFQQVTVKSPYDKTTANPGVWVVCTNYFAGAFDLALHY
jgi:hypothetical protein